MSTALRRRLAVAEALEQTQRERDELARLDPRLAVAVRHHRNTRGRPMLFRDRPYLVPIYCDRADRRTFMKPVQCGLSEMLIIDAFESASRGLQVLYVTPTQEKRNKFVANRVSRAIRASAHYRSLLRSGPGRANSRGLKHIGPGVINFVGSNANEFIEFPADLVIVDELDRCSSANMPFVRDRLAASRHKLEAYASTPTLAGRGIAEKFDASDAKEWFVRCEACGRRQPLVFTKNVVREVGDREFELIDAEWREGRPRINTDKHRYEERSGTGVASVNQLTHGRDGRATRDIRVFCAHCGRPIDRLAGGEWVARHPGRDVSGYHISQLFVPTITVAKLWADWARALVNDWERQRFHNSLLGEPYVPKGAGLDPAELLAGCRDYALPDRAKRSTMGVDVGEWLHVRISDQPEPGVRRAVFIGRVRSIDELDALMERYDVRCCVIDAQPESRLARQWQARYPRGRVWRCVYTDNDLRELRKDPRDGLLHVARTPSLDDATEDIRAGRNWLPRNAATLDEGEYVAQMTAPVRQLVETPRGGERFVWTHGVDHHRHADNYDKIASLVAPVAAAVRPVVGGRRITVLPPGRVFRAA